MHTWQLQEAKARLSELLKLCKTEGPQEISVHGVKTAVVISQQEYEKLMQKKKSFLDVMRESPLYDVALSLERDQSLPRDVEL